MKLFLSSAGYLLKMEVFLLMYFDWKWKAKEAKEKSRGKGPGARL